MAFKTHIDNATQNQPGQVTTMLTALLSAGVHERNRGDFAVTGTAGMAVNVAKGEAFVENSSYVYGSMDQRFFSIASSATEVVTVPANGSGNPRIDLICAKIDTGATPGVKGVNSGSVVLVQGTAAASPVPPAIPSNHEVLAQIAVANGETVISNGLITDRRRQASWGAPNPMWFRLAASGAYQSADSPSFVIRFASVDVSTYLTLGMRVRLKQGGSYKYFIVTKIDFSTNTDVTLYGGTDYTLTNTTITDLEFSSSKVPPGFPADPSKWTVEVSDSTVRTQSSPVAGTWYNLGSMTISIPIGVWDVSYIANALALCASASVSNYAVHYTTLSTANNSESDATWTNKVYCNDVTEYASMSMRQKVLNLTTKTSYYLNSRTDSVTTSGISLINSISRCVIRAVCAYL